VDIPHGSKLTELLNNDKVPASDIPAIEKAIEAYDKWIDDMEHLTTTNSQKVSDLVVLLNSYKKHIELELIWDSDSDFLYRQKGQLKLDNSILEEFLPYLVDPDIIPELATHSFETGSRASFASAYFSNSIIQSPRGAGLSIRKKDQDFTISRAAYLRSSHSPTFPDSDTTDHEIFLSFIAAECKTNLDKTMFQEASATAHDLKLALPGSKYFLICEWLDMTPISTAPTDIDEVLILRGKRIASNQRSSFSSAKSRVSKRSWYEDFLNLNPVRTDTLARLTTHIQSSLSPVELDSNEVLGKGYF
jgi:hypothetical protein